MGPLVVCATVCYGVWARGRVYWLHCPPFLVFSAPFSLSAIATTWAINQNSEQICAVQSASARPVSKQSWMSRPPPCPEKLEEYQSRVCGLRSPSTLCRRAAVSRTSGHLGERGSEARRRDDRAKSPAPSTAVCGSSPSRPAQSEPRLLGLVGPPPPPPISRGGGGPSGTEPEPEELLGTNTSNSGRCEAHGPRAPPPRGSWPGGSISLGLGVWDSGICEGLDRASPGDSVDIVDIVRLTPCSSTLPSSPRWFPRWSHDHPLGKSGAALRWLPGAAKTQLNWGRLRDRLWCVGVCV